MAEHEIDTSQIDERDEIDDGTQYCLVWCNTHQTWEWHWIEIDGTDTRRPR